jgi:hypothetical protein
MNTQPPRNFTFLGHSWSRISRLLVGAGLIATIAAVGGCGGSADQVIPTTTANTPLSVSNFSGLKGYTVGSSLFINS